MLTGAREATYANYTDAEKQLAALEHRLQKRPTSRTPAEIDAAIDAVLARAVVTRERVRGTVATISQNCLKIDARTKDACEELSELRTEHAVATETEKLREQVAVLRGHIAALRTHGGTIAPDPIGEFYAWVTGGFVSVRAVGFGFPLFFALLIETVSAFGPATIAAYAEASREARCDGPRQALTSHDAPRLAVAGDGRLYRDVLEWIAARALPAESNRALGLSELHADYVRWCAAEKRDAVAGAVFERAFDAARDLPELAGKIRKFGNRYYGIGLVQQRSIAGAGG